MTLDEAIKHAEEVADSHDRIKQIKAVTLEECRCAEEHRQLAEWLKDYKRLLEQQSCEDAISRQAVLNALYALCDTGETLKENPWRDNPHIDAVIETIEELPPVTPQLKMGHWKKKEDDTCWWYVCSECEQEPLKNRWNDDDVLSTFCPNCGAKMQEVEE